MELTMRVATRDMAQRLRRNWETNSEAVYAMLLRELLKDE
jgi:hypothetical protein